ncbi:methyltransferase domain-containing protein [Sphingomonas sp. 22176]|uniref:methyltransferase domain-containing protein n=1 Tax=Sphingomonas sp. 22176 TaxID=3453884 RepID=UPI003F8802EC
MRTQKILFGLNLFARGLEIGGGYNPLTNGANVKHLDHTDRETLCRKFAADGVDTSRVPEIDFVWDGTSYSQLIGDDRFDWVVASHVIEHVPCIISFLQDCSNILDHGGVLALAVPDKRYCFDYYRPQSSLARVIDSMGSKQPTPGALAEMVINASALGGDICWVGGRVGMPELIHSAGEAKAASLAAAEQYRDTHVWAFTPNSFRLLIYDLRALGFIDLGEIRFQPTLDGEFYIQLARENCAALNRVDLARAALME